ncbi:MAG TPA: hypothetical protein VIJ42_11285 [Stellaceae bacterium]
MTPLTNEEFATAQRFCQLISEKIAGLGLDVYVESNFRDFMKLRRKFAPQSVQNPTYDPEHSNISLNNAFWLRAVEPGGDTVAMIAQRVIDTENFLEDLRSLRLWHDRPGEVVSAIDIIDCSAAGGLSGRIGHAGGLWIDPLYRKKNLSGLLDHLGRGLLLKNFWFDHITAFIAENLAATGIAIKQYGWPEVEGRLYFDFLAGGPAIPIGFCHMSRAQSVEAMDRWLLLPDCNSIHELDEVGKILAH